MNKFNYRDIWVGEKGSILIIVAIGMLVFIGFTALIIDVGMAMKDKQRTEDALDAAVLAGIHYIGEPSSELAFNAARSYLESNLEVNLGREPEITEGENKTIAVFQDSNDSSANIVMEVDFLKKTLMVAYNKNIPLYFLRLLGYDFWSLHSEAKAQRGPVTKVKGIRPFGVPNKKYVEGMSYPLYGENTLNIPGYFGLIELGVVGSEELDKCLQSLNKSLNKNGITEYVICGYPNNLSIGDQLIASGKKVGQIPVSEYMEYGKVVLVPLVSVIEQKYVKIDGFATFSIDSITNNIVSGRFISDYTVSGDYDLDSDLLDTGTYAVKLIE